MSYFKSLTIKYKAGRNQVKRLMRISREEAMVKSTEIMIMEMR